MINVFLNKEYALVYGESSNTGQFIHGTTEKHKHTYVHIIVSLNSTFTVSVQGGQKALPCAGIMIDSNVPHAVVVSSDTIVFLIDKTTHIANQLADQYFIDKGYYVMPDFLVGSIWEVWEKGVSQNADIQDIVEQLFSLCQINMTKNEKKDIRIERALRYIEQSPGIYEGFVDDLAERASLSKSRFCHLFKEQVGMSISSYLLSSKVFKAYHYNFSGMNMTESAVLAGFNSLSHFSETHKNMFGFALSSYKENVNIEFR